MSDEPLFVIAYKLAKKYHKGQKRKFKKEPYIRHPERIASKFDDHYLKALALLHDVLEDTSATEDDLINAGIPTGLMSDIDGLTKRKYHTYYDYINLIMKYGSEAVIQVKIADLEDNMRDLPEGHQKDKYRFARVLLKTRLAIMEKDRISEMR